MAKASQVIVLAEDSCHLRFVRSYLQRLNYSNHNIRSEVSPTGRGCAEQWVRDRYAKEVAAYRWRSKRAKTALVVVIDADNGDVNRRLRQFARALADATLDARSDDENIAHLIPRRNIETWILCLSGREVDEDTNYSHEDVSSKVSGAAATFFTWTRLNFELPSHCIPSLRSAIPEAKRFE